MNDEQEIKQAFVVLAPGTIASDFSLKSLNKALGEAQVEFLPAVKTEENKWGGYQYTPLVVIVNSCRPSLTKHHLTVSQFPSVNLEEKTVTVYTRIVHWDSGEWMQNALELPGELALGKDGTPKFNQQTIGGSQTYAQKYAYKAILGIPDSEEMIDSTEEKGDLPARTRKTPAEVVPQTRPISDVRASAQKWADEMAAPKGPWALADDLLTCMVIGVTDKETKAKKPYLTVTWNGRVDGFNYGFNYHASLIPALKAAVGKPVTLRLSAKKSDDGKSIQYFHIEDVLEVDGVQHKEGKPNELMTQLVGSLKENTDAEPF